MILSTKNVESFFILFCFFRFLWYNSIMENMPKAIYKHLKGDKNPRWSGGKNSYYKNHYQLKINRLERLKQTKGKCEICQKDAKTIHHKDGDKNNHKMSNLAVLCTKHHNIIDLTIPCNKTSKYRRLYGLTLKEIAGKLQVSQYWARMLLYKDKKEIIKKLKNNP